MKETYTQNFRIIGPGILISVDDYFTKLTNDLEEFRIFFKNEYGQNFTQIIFSNTMVCSILHFYIFDGV